MLDTDLGTQLRELIPVMDIPADPMAALHPRIRRRRIGLAAAGATGLGGIVIAVLAVSSFVLSPGTANLSPAMVASHGNPVATAYDGTARSQLGGASAWLIAHRKAGQSTLDVIYFTRDGQACLALATTDSGVPSPKPATALQSECGGLSGVAMNVPFNASGQSGPNSVLYGRVPAATRIIRATLTGGQVAERYFAAISVPIDPSDRFFAVDVAGGGLHRLTGQLVFYNAAGRVIGQEHVDIRAPVRLPASSNCSPAPGTPPANAASACAETSSTH